MTPELAPPLLTTTPMGGRLSSRQIQRTSLPTRRDFSGTRFELVTCQPRSDILTSRLLRQLQFCGEKSNHGQAAQYGDSLVKLKHVI
ncbi:hypothetical protein TNCV_2130841 [Trichonephila clavipes]|nr:hypothetical protein TNCV_2130841 [Trichonephila clavipes]